MKRCPHQAPDLRARAFERRNRRAAIIASALLALVTVAAFTHGNPFSHGFRLRADMASSAGLKPGSEVRIAGVRVGSVDSIDKGPGNATVVTLDIDGAGLPVHRDATLAVRPRLILEGSFYVDLRPGSPGAPELPSGATIARGQTSVPVQLDQVLDTFNLATRGALHRSIEQFADGLGGRRPGRTGADGARRTVRSLAASLDSFRRVTRAARGTSPGDLGRAIRSSAATTGQLTADPVALADMVSNFDRMMGDLAANDQALAASVRGFDGVLRAAPGGLGALDTALPEVTRFADALRPALRHAPEALRATSRLLGEGSALMGSRELPALLVRLRPLTANLPSLERRLQDLLRFVTPIDRCLSSRFVPTLDSKLEDDANSTGDPAWLDMLHSFAGVTGSASNFDANGVVVRAGVTQGEASLKNVVPGIADAVGGGTDIQGVRPAWLGYGVEPPYRPDAECAKQPLPDLRARSMPAPAWMTIKAAGR